MIVSLFHKHWLSILIFFIIFLAILWMSPGIEFYLGSPDHGYQLSLGKQIVLGKFPFVDLFFHYGPLTAFSSAFGLGISDSLISETIICALGYTVAIFMIYYLTNFYVSNTAGLINLFLSFILIARFYKWYYWLFPLLALYFLHSFLKSQDKHQKKWLYVAGFFSSIGGLYRFDIGLVCLCFYTISPIVMLSKPFNLKLLVQQLTIFLMGFSLPFLLWLLILGLNGGTWQDYLAATFVGGKGITEKWSLPIPSLDWSNLFSPQSSAALSFILVPFTYLLSIVYSYWIEWRNSEQSNLKLKFAIAVSIMGLGILPQAFYRADVPHLLQVLPPALIAGTILVSELWQRRAFSQNNQLGRLFFKFIPVLYLTVVTISVWGIRDGGGTDLVKWNFNPIPRYQALSQGINSGIEHPIIRLISEVQKQTAANDRVLVVPIACQLYYFANRPMSGFINGFAAGNLDNDEWRDRNFQAIQKQPPAVVIVNEGFFNLPPTDPFREYQPELYEFLTKHYLNILYQQDGWMILSKSDI